jgi:hypothetical protein
MVDWILAILMQRILKFSSISTDLLSSLSCSRPVYTATTSTAGSAPEGLCQRPVHLAGLERQRAEPL